MVKEFKKYLIEDKENVDPNFKLHSQCKTAFSDD